MSISQDLIDDKAAIAATQATLAEQQSKLTVDQARADAVAPHLAILDNIEAELVQVEDAIDQATKDAMLAVQSMLAPYLVKLRAILDGE